MVNRARCPKKQEGYMSQLFSKAWWSAAGTRALKTAAQSLAPSIPTTIIISTQTDWFGVGYVVLGVIASAALMAFASLLTSIKGLPEVDCTK
jgi:hypothetical protein